MNKLLNIPLLKTGLRWSIINIFLLGFSVKAQQTPKDADLDYIKHRQFDKTSIDAYKNDKRFQYQQTPRPEQPSLMFRLSEWLWQNIGEPLNNPKQHPVRSTIYYLIISGILIYAILKLINADLSFMGGKKSKSEVVFAELAENIHEMDFNQLIAEAKTKQNYRRAVRLLYLHTLKKLTDQSLIDWQIDKTNHEYEQELAYTSLHPSFQAITLRFEYFCYGDFQLDHTAYNDTEAIFIEFETKLAQYKPKPTQALL